MAYLPKSKITIKTSEIGELVYALDLAPFRGQYIVSSDGKFYAGTNHLVLGRQLTYAPEKPDLDGYGDEEKTKDVQIHNVLKPETISFIGNTQNIISAKSVPTEKDYEKGYYPRYFFKRINDFNYKEINKDTYDSISSKSGEYDHHLHEVGKLNWHLVENVFKKNTTSIKITTRTFPGIQNLFPILNEFYREINDPVPQNNLNTTGKELYYNDGKEYIGLYHIHPEKGPMVGAQHTLLNHDKLYYSNQLPKVMGSKYEDFINSLPKSSEDLLIIDRRPVNPVTSADIKVNQQRQTTTTTPTNIPSFGGGGSSGGGGGGY